MASPCNSAALRSWSSVRWPGCLARLVPAFRSPARARCRGCDTN